ncbi:3'-phosphoadenosine 5'-phosphosulfate sulfotransferase (PAPS reductase)/FAD synthetase [Dysgonomonas sp. PFB1-18]|uniref:phosphoadenosine phosphosulfate reductase domain-containing protein n=1 Tax=unclassified Dysgonomonas TaxID=2630389 RepID=UPI0024746275|nr:MULTISPECIES: phosphoadenosine phosphosulfate reductase family protein [unclassified Dysgonomonas]MDH6308111.1 3'-phosphoadenosine 5'-phosphosulfate sulfotransferase (PAPS reductase)/FAD synthetase [Dysgonomonas sp. PF1-14]MDH6339650.1 3'-phosphoadenosine 5'-phosphosulfate sulfotransferase (PAPS reductase)/FAD synthetase [Dysgonomonas sp. PF1-16]MDH6381301.1 3'-phosphoadenosine 5'-phosphosulfate sulfotransferase (PAPS reductase)/FAD synthetase [Dysgonomonas sp. PFB1-18]MDH6398513.1 3'-phosph
MDAFDLHSYDHYIVSFSGGKDSTACFLYLLEQGVPKEKIELWHQEIDGREQTFFDWEITPDYCRKFAVAFGVPIYFQWKEGGFKREMFRENSLTAPIYFELPNGCINKAGGEKGKLSTRLRFPQASADLKVRWCSAYLKIDVCSTSLINQERFRNKRTLILSGERGEESPQRAKYKILEPDRADLRNGKAFTRHVDRFRPIRDWKEQQVWEIIEKYRVRVHPCYYMGWGRCSCKFCIFGNKNQFASAAKISPEQIQYIIELEKLFKCTIKRNMDLQTLIDSGTAYEAINGFMATLATQSIYDVPIIIPDDDVWLLPAGAYGENCGAA